MSSINADEVRIPRLARDAVARHETVVVINRERPVLALVHPDDVAPATAPRGRAMGALAAALRVLPDPDPAFADDMEEVLRSVGPGPDDPWAPS